MPKIFNIKRTISTRARKTEGYVKILHKLEKTGHNKFLNKDAMNEVLAAGYSVSSLHAAVGSVERSITELKVFKELIENEKRRLESTEKLEQKEILRKLKEENDNSILGELKSQPEFAVPGGSQSAATETEID